LIGHQDSGDVALKVDDVERDAIAGQGGGGAKVPSPLPTSRRISPNWLPTSRSKRPASLPGTTDRPVARLADGDLLVQGESAVAVVGVDPDLALVLHEDGQIGVGGTVGVQTVGAVEVGGHDGAGLVVDGETRAGGGGQRRLWVAKPPLPSLGRTLNCGCRG